MNKKRILGMILMSSTLLMPIALKSTSVLADGFYSNQDNAERADITNWVANSPQQISSNIASQHLDVNNLHGDRYVIQWGDTLSGISSATGISIKKLAYDNHIQNIDLIYAGDVLILNRDGEVPTDYTYYGTGTYVALTQIQINNYEDNSQNVNINVSPVINVKVSGDAYKPAADADKSNSNGNSSNSSNDDKTKDELNNSSSKHSKKDTDDEEMSMSDFKDAVQDAINDYLNSNISFDGDSGSNDSDSTSGTETENVYNSDQTVKTDSKKLTSDNADDVAKQIAEMLQADGKTHDLGDADSAVLSLSKDGDGFKFNIAATTSKDDDSSSSDSSSDKDSDDQSSKDDDSDSTKDEESDDQSSKDDDNDSDTDKSDDDTDTDKDVDSSSSEKSDEGDEHQTSDQSSSDNQATVNEDDADSND